ncbi:hypothetical protein [Arthrobacter pigmenti]
MGWHRLTVWLVFVGLLTASCSPSGSDPQASTTPASTASSTTSRSPVPKPEIDPANTADVQTINCEPAIDEAAELSDISNDPLGADVMVLAGGGPGKPDQPIKWHDSVIYQGMHFIKIGMAVHRDREFILEVPPSWQQRMRIGWGSGGYTLASTLKVPGCVPEDTGAEWMVFPGGFWLEEPGCVPLNIQTDSRTQTIRVPIGERCP